MVDRMVWTVGVVMMACSVAVAEGPASTPSTAPAASAPAPRWHSKYGPAAEEARRRGVLLVVILVDPEAPACQALEEQVLSAPATRRFLSDFATAKLDVRLPAVRKRFPAVTPETTPLTQVFSPAGELLDSIPGCVLPASSFCQRLARSQAYYRAATTRPAGPAAVWAAIQARLRLSTRQRAVGQIDKLLKLPRADLPRGVTPARLHLAKGEALLRADPPRARKHLERAGKLAGDDTSVAAEALFRLGELAAYLKQYRTAHKHYADYIKRFPRGRDVGRAYFRRAMLEWTALDDQAAARDTLRALVRLHPDDPAAVKARAWLKLLASGKEKSRP